MTQSSNLFRSPLFRWGIPAMTTILVVAIAVLFIEDRTVRLMMLAVAAVDIIITPQVLKRVARST